MLARVGCRLAWALLALALTATPAQAAADWDPAAAIAAYSAALNAHDLEAGLALFDEYGSATDVHGRHYEGPASLTEFLVANGFGHPDAYIQTERLHIVANRAVWTYSCSCAPASTEVRMVTNHNKISVFAVQAPPSGPIRPRSVAGPPWLVYGTGLAGLAGFALHLARRRSAERSPRGSLLTALAVARQDRRKLY
jgi:hypothetical protein